MEEEKKLYPFRFCPVEDQYEWGAETFRLADLGYRDTFVRDGWLAGNAMSEVMDMYMDRVVGDNIFEYYGRQFPFQIKTIQVNGKMPLRVHPEDEISAQRYDLLGKEKLWYIKEADEGAHIFLGLFRDSDAGEVCERCSDSSIDGILNRIDVRAGDHFHITPGTMHAAEGKMTIIEVSESSPLDFCLCAWGKEISSEEFDDSLTMADALDFIDYRKYVPECCHHHHHGKEMIHKLVQIPQFTASLVRLGDPLHIYSEQFDSCISYSCLNGAASIQTVIDGITMNYPVSEGETILVPAEIPDFIIAATAPGTELIETLLDKREEVDPYINPDAEPSLDDDGCDDDDDCDDEGCGCHHHDHKIYS